METTHAAELLADLNNEIKELEKKAEALKKFLKDNLGEGTHICGNVVVEIRSQIRESLDRNAMEKEFGIDVVNKFAKLSEFKVLMVKKALKV